MKYHVLTLFPEMIEQGLSASILGKAREKKLIELNLVNIRDYTDNKHRQVDDYPFGGGAGMVMQPQPIMSAFRALQLDTPQKPGEYNLPHKPRLIYLTPQGKVFNQRMAEDFSKEEELIFLCGHYEGVDERVIESIVTDEVSIGDYVLTGGELAVMVIIDAISRLIPGVLNNDESKETETFDDGLLEYPQYTRPAVYEEQAVPEILLSGHHAKIEKWRREQSLMRTANKRPDLLNTANLSEADRKFLKNYLQQD